MVKPIVSIIIPTYHKSDRFLQIPLKSIKEQRCPKKLYEVIISDNNGGKTIKAIAQEHGAKIVSVKGNPPQSCRQVNLGAKEAKGEYIFILDHDIELETHLIANFASLASKEKEIDAWYVPYKIVAKSSLLTKIRNFEENFYYNSVVAAPRILKRETFWKTESQYDTKLNAGPADWDLANQLRLLGVKFGYIRDYVYHHEEELGLWEFISKKNIYAEGSEVYKNKWRKKNPKLYREVVRKQYSPLYRFFWIFVENGNWKKLLLNTHFYLLFLALKTTTAFVYLVSRRV